MPAIRGSTSSLLAIKEVTPGVTPSTPAMKDLPIVNFTPRGNYSVIRSEAIRAHPFNDKILNGARTTEVGIDWELGTGHDLLLETFLGENFTSDVAKFVDALKCVSMESRAGGGSSKFDHFLGYYLSSLSISAAASDTTPVRVSGSGRALTASLDDASTIANSVVAAGSDDPFIFVGAELTVNGVATDVTSGTINLERQVDPLGVWGHSDPREYVPGAATATGSITVPYDDGTQSALFEGFTDAELIFTFASLDGDLFRNFTFPATKFVSLGRPIQGRGVRLQEINWEAEYSVSDGTVLLVEREDSTP